MSSDDLTVSRRTLIGSVGVGVGLAALGSVAANEGPGRDPPEDAGPRDIEWDGERGKEYAELECADSETGQWDLVLTPGGRPSLEGVGQLTVIFDDGYELSVSGEQRGEGAYHFTALRPGGGKIISATVPIDGGGPNAHLTISDGRCLPPEVQYWQVDFGEGDAPPDIPDYGDSSQDLIMSAMGSSNGVTWNPSFVQGRPYVGVNDSTDIDEWDFVIDDADEPREISVTFTIPDDTEDVPAFHLAVFTRPRQAFDTDPCEDPPGSEEIDLDAQLLFRSKGADDLSPGDSETLTLPLPGS